MTNFENIKRPSRTLNRPKISGSTRVWLAVLVLMLAAKIILDAFFPKAFADPAQASFFRLENLVTIWLMGFLGVWLSRKTGFPDALAAGISNWKRFGLPGLVGLLAGAIFVAVDMQTHFTAIGLNQQQISQQYTGFVPMLLIFTVASIIVEVVFRLFLIPVLLWFVSNLIMGGRNQQKTFWTLAILTSAFEPLAQIPVTLAMAPALMIFMLVTQYAINFTQAVFFREYGFVAAIMLRVGFYLVFHVLYIH